MFLKRINWNNCTVMISQKEMNKLEVYKKRKKKVECEEIKVLL